MFQKLYHFSLTKSIRKRIVDIFKQSDQFKKQIKNFEIVLRFEVFAVLVERVTAVSLVVSKIVVLHIVAKIGVVEILKILVCYRAYVCKSVVFDNCIYRRVRFAVA